MKNFLVIFAIIAMLGFIFGLFVIQTNHDQATIRSMTPAEAADQPPPAAPVVIPPHSAAEPPAVSPPAGRP